MLKGIRPIRHHEANLMAASDGRHGAASKGPAAEQQPSGIGQRAL